MKEMYIWNIGLINIPEDLNRIISTDGRFLISPTVSSDHYFEMAGEAMYYALSDLELTESYSCQEYKKKIVECLISRVEFCDGYLYHDSLSSNDKDTQLRSSSSAIRILIESSKDGFNVYDIISKLANSHFKYYFEWKEGIWFCHDSSEYENKGPKTHLRSTVLKKQRNNTLTLNTHFDSLSTLLLLKKIENKITLNFSIDECIDKAINSLCALSKVDSKHSLVNKYLQKIDQKILNHNILNSGILSKVYERIAHPVLFKLLSPTFFFDYGFIARDMAVMNRHLDYHIVNMVDIARVLCLLKHSIKGSYHSDLICCYSVILKRGLSLFESVPNYNAYIYTGDMNIAWMGELAVLLDYLSIEYPFKVDSFNFPHYNPFTR